MAKLSRAKDAAVNWAIACDLRKALSRAQVLRWRVEGLTRREERHIRRALSHLAAAEQEVQLLQASLAERSKLNGDERPNYQAGRAINP